LVDAVGSKYKDTCVSGYAETRGVKVEYWVEWLCGECCGRVTSSLHQVVLTQFHARRGTIVKGLLYDDLESATMLLMSRIISRLGAISIKTGALPLFSWSLVSRNAEVSSAKEAAYTEVVAKSDSQDLRHLVSTHVDQGRKVFFMGEHHEQPRVLAAQLTMLDELVRQAGVRKKPVILVAEQFNVLQHAMLDQFCTVPEQPSEEDEIEAASKLLDDYTEDAGEGFDLTHYMPLLLCARSAGVRLVGGFPPRAWARIVAKEGVDALKEQKAEELRALEFDRFEDLHVSPEHAAYLRSLMSGEAPALAERGVPPRPIHTAQAFKDAMLALTIDKVLAEHGGNAIVFVLTGSGHCEYGFGGPERLRKVNRDEMSILVCKSNQESTIWQGDGWGDEATANDRVVADAVFCYDQV
jgi:uncharacterized iron-regulated protein